MNAWFAAGATAVLMSERGRNFIRRAVVYGVANAMNASETVTSAATEVAQGAERVASSAGGLAGDLVGEAQQARHAAEAKSSNSSTRARAPRTTRAKAAGAGR